MLKRIEKNITKRMSEYTDSRHPTDDEVAIAWLVAEVNRLREGTAVIGAILSKNRSFLEARSENEGEGEVRG